MVIVQYLKDKIYIHFQCRRNAGVKFLYININNYNQM